MNKTQINPWTWQDALGFSQCLRLEAPTSLLFLAGQSPTSAEGRLVGSGDFDAQARQVFENMRTVLEQAGADFSAVVKIVLYLTDIRNLADYERIAADYLPHPKPVGTALGVAALAVPGMLIEVDATAVV
ncbi:MAG TPA: RidA family protein [Solirubrobacteraceae bacterium]